MYGNPIGGMYQDGSRFSLAGRPSTRPFAPTPRPGGVSWSEEEWAQFFTSASQLYGTVFNKPVQPLPAPQVQTPIGKVPSWGLVIGGLVAATAAILLLTPARR